MLHYIKGDSESVTLTMQTQEQEYNVLFSGQPWKTLLVGHFCGRWVNSGATPGSLFFYMYLCV